jgi:YHS domain-containing protein
MSVYRNDSIFDCRMPTRLRGPRQRQARASALTYMKTIIRFVVAALALATITARAEKPVNTTLFGVAIKGYDSVAYFSDGKAVKGDSKINYAWNGATWQFASIEHRDAFKLSPEKYAPQFGGYCAWAVSQGYTANVDPERAWKVVNEKLYLNYDRGVQKKWEQDIPGFIAKAEVNWPKLIGK